MKDMSEEKDKKKPTISDLEKLLENEPNAKVYIKPDGTIDVVNLTEQIKSLESRLKEAQKGLADYANVTKHLGDENDILSKALGDAQASTLTWKSHHSEEIQSLSKRLSQAEAEVQTLRNGEKGWCKQVQELQKQNTILHQMLNEDKQLIGQNKLDELQARLSHLMDVAGKMASVFEELKKEYQPRFHNYRWSLSRIYAALAEWDGIKEGGK